MEGPSLIFTLASFVVALSVLVFVHEWGHYIVARLCGVKVEVFSIGFGPELAGWYDSKGTRWRVSALPIGGYVRFFGDANEASQPGEMADTLTEEEKAVAFQTKSVGKRAAIVAAGPLINFAFAILIFAVFYTISGKPVAPAIVEEVTADSAAEAAGLQPGDRITAVDGRAVDSFDDLAREIQVHPEMALTLTVERGGSIVDVPVTPRRTIQEDRFGNQYAVGQLGVIRTAGQEEVRQFGPLGALWEGMSETYSLTRLMLQTTGQIIMGMRSLDDLGGPIKIAKVSGEQASLGLAAFVGFMALISINLGLVNLFPVPMLDGGHLLFYAIEAIKGSPVSIRVQELGYMMGMALVLGLMLFLTWNDLQSL